MSHVTEHEEVRKILVLNSLVQGVHEFKVVNPVTIEEPENPVLDPEP